MATLKRSNIGWTDLSGGDLNFVIRGRRDGECECSPGCQNCYARGILQRSGASRETTTFYPAKMERLKKATVPPGENRRGPGSRPMAFVCDMGDICHPAVTDFQIAQAFGVMIERDDIDWQVLTKRPGRLPNALSGMKLPDHIWVGTTVELQKQDDRIDDLLGVNAATRFLSIEPMLGEINILWCDWCGGWGWHDCENSGDGSRRVDWVIVGAESGPKEKRRPFDAAWARSIRDQCRDAGVAFFGKQDSDLHPGRPLLIDGQEVKEWPR